MSEAKNQDPVGRRDEFAGTFVETAFTNGEIESTVDLEDQAGMRDGGPGDGCEFLRGAIGKAANEESK